MQTEYRIEKASVPVVLLTLSGERLEGEVFLQPYSQNRRGPEEVADLLNGAEPFFPLRCRDGAIRMLLKDRIVQAELVMQPPEDDARPLGAREAIVELTLATGEQYAACIFYQVPTARPRLLDYMNRLTQRFLLVHVEDRCRLVNWRLLDCIRPLD